MKHKFYEVEVGTDFHIYTKYTVSADSEEEAIRLAEKKKEKSNLHNFLKLNRYLGEKFPDEFVAIYEQSLLPEPYRVEELNH